MSKYLNDILNKYTVAPVAVKFAIRPIVDMLHNWAGQYLVGVDYSGSLAKGTAIHLSSDADLFISLSSTTPHQLKTIFDSLYSEFSQGPYSARKQDVSIGISYSGYKIDLVPGRRISQFGNDHSLYLNSRNSWTKTNVYNHIGLVQNSKRIDEIKLLKIWRTLHGLKFPSIYLELFTLDALYGKHEGNLDRNFQHLLEYAADYICSLTFKDPSNTNNIISDEIGISDKRKIEAAAKIAANATNWGTVVW